MYLFGLQDGSMRLLTDNLEWKQLYQSPNKKEITCWGYNVGSKDKKILIGTGFIQKDAPDGSTLEEKTLTQLQDGSWSVQ